MKKLYFLRYSSAPDVGRNLIAIIWSPVHERYCAVDLRRFELWPISFVTEEEVVEYLDEKQSSGAFTYEAIYGRLGVEL